jgi:hypothetical protein
MGSQGVLLYPSLWPELNACVNEVIVKEIMSMHLKKLIFVISMC